MFISLQTTVNFIALDKDMYLRWFARFGAICTILKT